MLYFRTPRFFPLRKRLRSVFFIWSGIVAKKTHTHTLNHSHEDSTITNSSLSLKLFFSETKYNVMWWWRHVCWCCFKNNPCQNGGSCTEKCEPTSVRYNCSCPENFIGRHCEFERKSCQAYKAAGESKSRLYTIIDDSNQSFQAFCDFDS